LRTASSEEIYHALWAGEESIRFSLEKVLEAIGIVSEVD